MRLHMRREMTQLLIVLLLAFVSANVKGQEIKVLGFSLLKKKEMKKEGLKGDKSQATIDFITSEKGFTFKADGKIDLSPQEGEDKISLFMPHKTRYLTIKHPDYGELTWLAPVKNLRKKKIGRAHV